MNARDFWYQNYSLERSIERHYGAATPPGDLARFVMYLLRPGGSVRHFEMVRHEDGHPAAIVPRVRGVGVAAPAHLNEPTALQLMCLGCARSH